MSIYDRLELEVRRYCDLDKDLRSPERIKYLPNAAILMWSWQESCNKAVLLYASLGDNDMIDVSQWLYVNHSVISPKDS